MCKAITGEKPPAATDRNVDEDEFEWLGCRNISGYSEKFLLAVDWALRVKGGERPQSIGEWRATLEKVPETANEPTTVVLPPAPPMLPIHPIAR